MRSQETPCESPTPSGRTQVLWRAHSPPHSGEKILEISVYTKYMSINAHLYHLLPPHVGRAAGTGGDSWYEQGVGSSGLTSQGPGHMALPSIRTGAGSRGCARARPEAAPGPSAHGGPARYFPPASASFVRTEHQRSSTATEKLRSSRLQTSAAEAPVKPSGFFHWEKPQSVTRLEKGKQR